MKRYLVVSLLLVMFLLLGCPRRNSPPAALNVAITGDAQFSKRLVGMYEFHDPDGDKEGSSIFRWFRSNSIQGEKELIDGETETSYVVQSVDVEKQLFFQVTPVDSRGNKGDPVLSPPTQVIPTPPTLSISEISLPAGEWAYVTVVGEKLGAITSIQFVIEYDPSYIDDWDSINLISLLSGQGQLRIAEKVTNNNRKFMYIALSGLEAVIDHREDLLKIRIKAGEKSGTTELSFSECTLALGDLVRTRTIPPKEIIDMTQAGKVNIQN